jgi:LysR family transcriptional regulator, nitrogen assimilation regulatory protein
MPFRHGEEGQRHMELKQLAALVTVADVGSVTKAARLLHLVQPAVTRQIRLLEEEVGVALFERTPQGMTPTPAGAAFVERARRALHELERARTEARPSSEQVTGLVTIGLLESVTDLLVQPLLAALEERYPGIEVRILTAYSGHLQTWLDDGDVDLATLYNVATTQSLAVLPLVREPLWAVAPPDSGLVAGQPIRWATLFDQPLVLPVSGHGLRALIDQARSALPAQPHIRVETNSMHLQKALVLAGHGWTVLPAAGVAGDVRAGVLSGAPLTEPDVARALVLALRRGARTPRPVEVVANELLGLTRSLTRTGRWPSAEPIADDPG